MYVAEKRRVHPRSFHHRIRDGAMSFFDTNHLMGLDPMDRSKFQRLYEQKEPVEREVVPEEDTQHMISKW